MSMQLKLSLLTLSSLTIIGAIANQSSWASQLKQDDLVSSTTTSSQVTSCTSTNISDAICTSTNNNQSVPDWGDHTFDSSTNIDKSADVGTQNQGIDQSDRTGSSFEQQSNESNPKTNQSSPSVNTQSNLSTSKDEDSISAIEQEVHNQINQYRAKKGLPSLTLDNTISEQARKHSQNMASGAVAFSHDGSGERVKAIALTISYSSSAENVAYNQGYGNPATQAVEGWLNSSGHLKNIQGNYNLTGIGVAKNAENEYYFTQLFIRSR